jgi:hypothetical protein
MKFYLIQRGIFNEKGTCLTGDDGVVDLEYMGSLEFETGVVQKSFRRIMYNFDDYIYTKSGIYTKDGNELVLFSENKSTKEILESLKFYIANPYKLKEYSNLDRLPNSSNNDPIYNRVNTNFWWDVKNDWMGFLNLKNNLFETGINNDYNDWWLKKPEEVREEEYTKSLRRK